MPILHNIPVRLSRKLLILSKCLFPHQEIGLIVTNLHSVRMGFEISSIVPSLVSAQYIEAKMTICSILQMIVLRLREVE